jgi:hypothetical protein
MSREKKEHIETLKWFEEFYNRNKKMVDIIVADNKKKMIEYEIPDFIAYIAGEYKKIKVYRIKGFTKFNWDELSRTGTTLELFSLNGIPQAVYCNSNYYPGIRYIGKKQYLSEKSLKRLREIFKSLIINLEYYKKYNNMEVE